MTTGLSCTSSLGLLLGLGTGQVTDRLAQHDHLTAILPGHQLHLGLVPELIASVLDRAEKHVEFGTSGLGFVRQNLIDVDPDRLEEILRYTLPVEVALGAEAVHQMALMHRADVQGSDREFAGPMHLAKDTVDHGRFTDLHTLLDELEVFLGGRTVDGEGRLVGEDDEPLAPGALVQLLDDVVTLVGFVDREQFGVGHLGSKTQGRGEGHHGVLGSRPVGLGLGRYESDGLLFGTPQAGHDTGQGLGQAGRFDFLEGHLTGGGLDSGSGLAQLLDDVVGVDCVGGVLTIVVIGHKSQKFCLFEKGLCHCLLYLLIPFCSLSLWGIIAVVSNGGGNANRLEGSNWGNLCQGG